MILFLSLLGCPQPQPPVPTPLEDADVYVDVLGDPVPFLEGEMLSRYQNGQEIMEEAFTSDNGLGPTFNTDSCAGCHQFPVAGGSAPRYRDFWLVQRERFDGAREDVGSNGQSPVRNLYTVDGGHIPEALDTTVYARRNAPSALGIGLFEFVPDEVILSRADEDDVDGDGISGRPNFEQGKVGRFGYKAQAATLESFNRGAMFNQMGVTSNPIHTVLPEHPEEVLRAPQTYGWLEWAASGFPSSAVAQVSAPDEPTVDDDPASDPEISDLDQEDLLIFSVYLGVPRPAEPTDMSEHGQELFVESGCASCHTERIASTVGWLYAYSDLLLHDMGDDLADGIGPGLSTASEFRTQPLWGVRLHGPYLHDGSADTLDEAIRLHGGEGASSAAAYEALSTDDQGAVIAFLEGLGGWDPEHHVKLQPGEAIPAAGEPGGPDLTLSTEEQSQWERGRELFDQTFASADGLGHAFNADSCRACHQDPVLGGAGGFDTNVIRVGHRDDTTGEYTPAEIGVLPRVIVPGQIPLRLPDEVNVIEHRNPPTVLGIGHIDGISEAAILAGEDPDDLDSDGISGRARILTDGRVGRFGWKANVPSVQDFVADAMLNEMGVTVDPALSDFTVDDDDDEHVDPELSTSGVDDLSFYLGRLAPPVPLAAEDADAVVRGEGLFTSVGCAGCHTPELDGVPLHSDLLLHDIAPDPDVLVDQEEGLLPTEFRTPPLWGVAETAPYLHDGHAATLDAAVRWHSGEATAVRESYEGLDEASQQDLVAYLRSL